MACKAVSIGVYWPTLLHCMVTIESTFAIFFILGISSLALFWAKRLRVPHTVLLVCVGIALGFLNTTNTLTFLGEFHLTPELLFYLLLPTLIFESAYNINARRMVEDTPIILVLSVIGLLVSTVLIALGLYFILPYIGIEIPLMVALLFGSLISATDPVAVLALFKQCGAPRRLSLIFEGESLFNDATAVALFLILLEVITFGYHGFTTVIEGVFSFASMLIGGVLFGTIIGGLFAKVIGWSREDEVASITLTLVLAHITFILAEIASDYMTIGTFQVQVSPIIATTVAALLMGNYGRSKIHPRAEEFVEKLWGQLAFWANSLIFVLIGVLFMDIPTLTSDMIAAILITILIVAIARALSIYPVVQSFNVCTSPQQKIPLSWQHLLSWGSLRGALAITMVLLIPDNIIVPNWSLSLSPKEFLLALTVGCIAATLFVKATTIQYVMRRLRLDQLTEIEKIEAAEARALIHHEVRERIKKYEERGYIHSSVAVRLLKEHTDQYQRACDALHTNSTGDLAKRVLRIYAIGIEKKHLKQLYHYNEVTERVYKKLSGKLQLQLEAIEAGNLAPNMSIHSDGKDIFEHIANAYRSFFETETEEQKIDTLYLYYRAQTIISRKVLKELQTIDTDSAEHIFTKDALLHVLEIYKTFKEQSEKKMINLADKHTERYQALSENVAMFGIKKIEELALQDLFERQLITPKLFIALKEELD